MAKQHWANIVYTMENIGYILATCWSSLTILAWKVSPTLRLLQIANITTLLEINMPQCYCQSFPYKTDFIQYYCFIESVSIGCKTGAVFGPI